MNGSIALHRAAEARTVLIEPGLPFLLLGHGEYGCFDKLGPVCGCPHSHDHIPIVLRCYYVPCFLVALMSRGSWPLLVLRLPMSLNQDWQTA